MTASVCFVVQLSTTTAAPLPNFSFAAAGDWACNSNSITTVKNIAKINPNLVLGLGDYLNESKNPDCWFKIVKPIDEKMRIAIGNHAVSYTHLTLPTICSV